jgi:ApaG protein
MTDKSRIYQAKTNRIVVTVKPTYQHKESNPSIGKFIFSYQVTIENNGFEPVKLISRHWLITDSLTPTREVVGEGVVGLQPVIEENQSFEYASWSPINSAIGMMSGTYTFIKVKDGSQFDVKIPPFYLYADYILN